jgi:hypothetical protein
MACQRHSCPHVQVIICSCSAHLDPSDIHILGSGDQTKLNTPASLLELRDLIYPLLPTSIPGIPQANIQSIGRAGVHIQNLNLPSRAIKYIRNPFKIFGLVNRGRVQAQSLLSPRLLFNIACVIIWVLVQRILEIIGIRIPGISMRPVKKPGVTRPVKDFSSWAAAAEAEWVEM